jgi:acyl-CoA dehydrogenase
MTVDPLLTETADRLFAETCTHATVQQAEDDGGAPAIWSAFAETGFAHISIPESAGGSGGTLTDILEVIRLAGYHSAPIPVAENAMLGGWLLASAGLSLPDGIVTVVPGTSRDTLHLDSGVVSGSAHMVPWGRHAERVAFTVDGTVVSVPVTEAEVTEGTSLAGEPRDTLMFHNAAGDIAAAPDGVNAETLRFRGALSRVALMAGAIERMSQLTVSYTNEREQFGRPVSRFQAVQQHLVWAAQDAALTRMAAEVAGREAERSESEGGTARFEIASAKLVANQAATRSTRASHQAHGAMGMTQEYPLHHLSRRLWSWRKEYGGEREWGAWVGRAALAAGPDGLYPLMAGGNPTVIGT